jgi:hypothetical protein
MVNGGSKKTIQIKTGIMTLEYAEIISGADENTEVVLLKQK